MRKLSVLTLLFIIMIIMSSPASADDPTAVRYRLSIESTPLSGVAKMTEMLTKAFEQCAISRGFVVKHNYKEFSSVIYKQVELDSPLSELSTKGIKLMLIMPEGRNEISEASLVTLSKERGNGAEKFGFADGRTGESFDFTYFDKTITSEALSAFDRLKLDELLPAFGKRGDTSKQDPRRVSVKTLAHFFPKLNDYNLRFSYLTPTSDFPLIKTEFAPLRLRFGAILDTDVFITFWHDMATKQMVHANISWRAVFNQFTTGEEAALCESFFEWVQERFSKLGLIAPAALPK